MKESDKGRPGEPQDSKSIEEERSLGKDDDVGENTSQ